MTTPLPEAVMPIPSGWADAQGPTITTERKAAFLRCDYEEFSPETYRGMTLLLDEKQYRFFTGQGYYADQRAAFAFCKENQMETMMHASSVDHFVTDAVNAFSKGPNA